MRARRRCHQREKTDFRRLGWRPMSFVTAIQSIASRWNSADSFLNAPLRIVDPQRSASLDKGGTPGSASFPRRPVAFLLHYVKRRPILHAVAVTSVLGAAAFA